MGRDDRSQAGKEAELLGVLQAAAIEGITSLLSKLHHMDGSSKLGATGIGKELESALGRSSNLAFDSWTLGLHTWRQMLELGRKYDTDMLPGYLGRAAVWVDPTAELASATTVLKLFSYNGKEKKKENEKEKEKEKEVQVVTAETKFSGLLRIANRSKYTHQLDLPRTLELRDAAGTLSLAELRYEPDVPTLSPGDEVELWVEVAEWHLGKPDKAETVARFGELAIRTHGPLGVTVPVVVKGAQEGKRPDSETRSRDRVRLRRKRATSRSAASRRPGFAGQDPG